MTGRMGLSLLVNPPWARSTTAWAFARIALRQREIVSHAELIAIAKDRRAGKSEHQAVGEFDAPAVAVEHRSEPAPDAALIKLHRGFRSERREYRSPVAAS